MASGTALEVFGLQKAPGLDLFPPNSGCSLSDRPDETGWLHLVGLRRSRGQITKGFEELLHLLLKKNVPRLRIFVSPLRVPEPDLQHAKPLLLLVQLLLKADYLRLVL